MTPVARWHQIITSTTLYALAFIVPFFIWCLSAGNPLQYFTQKVPPGQLPYILSKLAGLLAFSCFWLQCLFALAGRAPVLQNSLPALSTRAHTRLGLATVGLIVAHLGLFFAAVTLRTGNPAWGLLLPDFTGGYYQLHVSFGLIGLWLLLLAVFAGWQVYRGKKIWKKAHMAWVAVFALVFWHAFTIGSESRYGAMRYVFLLMATSLVAVVLSRLGFAWQAKKKAVLATRASIKQAQ